MTALNVAVSGTGVSEAEGVLDGCGVSVGIAVFVGAVVSVKIEVLEGGTTVTVEGIACGTSPQAIMDRIKIPGKMKR